MKMKVLLTVVMLALPIAASAQRAASTDPSFRDPGTATIYSVVLPGGGQLYSGETGRGLMMLVGSSAAVLAGTALSTQATCTYDASSFSGLSCKQANRLPLTIGMLGSLGIWGYGILDAKKSAERQNLKRAHRVSRIEPVMDVGVSRATVGIGIAF